MNKPLVSVVVPVYNCEQYIAASLKSIINQGFEDYEIIVYNDGSTDHSVQTTGETLRKYHKKDNYRHFVFQENRGVFAVRSDAIRMSKGKYIALHDADDMSFANRLKEQVGFLEEHSEIWCVGSHALKIGLNDYSMGLMDYPPQMHCEIFDMVLNDRRNPIIDPSVMFRKEIFDGLSGYSLKDDRYLVDDFDLWCRALCGGYLFHNIQKLLIKYRVNPDGNTRKHKSLMNKQHMIVYNEYREVFKYGYRGKISKA